MATFVKVRTRRALNTDEIREVLSLMELQETTDKYIDTQLRINGDDAVIDVDIDEDGNIVVL